VDAGHDEGMVRGVACLEKVVGAGDAGVGVVGVQGAEVVADGAAGGAGGGNGGGEHVGRVVSEGRVFLRHRVVARFERGDEAVDGVAVVAIHERGRDINILGVGGVGVDAGPTIAADEGGGEVLAFGFVEDGFAGGGEAGDEDDIGVEVGQRRHVGLVAILGDGGIDRGDEADGAREAGLECAGETAAVGIVLVQDRGLARVERGGGEVGERCPVDGVAGDDAEDPRGDAREIGRRGGRGDGDEVAVVDRGGRQHGVGIHVADDAEDRAVGDEQLGGGDGIAAGGAVIGPTDFHGAAADAAGGVQLGNGELDPLAGGEGIIEVPGGGGGQHDRLGAPVASSCHGQSTEDEGKYAQRRRGRAHTIQGRLGFGPGNGQSGVHDMRGWFRVIGLALVVGVGRSAWAQMQPDSVRALGRHYTAAFYAGDVAGLEARFTPALRQKEDSAKLASDQQQAMTKLGKEHGLIKEEVNPTGPWMVYVREITVDNIAEAVAVRWAIGGDGSIGAFSVRPVQRQVAPSQFLLYKTRTALQLPFQGAWLVQWGGRTMDENQHAASPDQRFADDFVLVKNGVTHAGAGTANSDYFAFGQPVLAVGAGTVVVAFDSVEDNVPGTMNTAAELGNYVVIDHGNGEYSFLAHLQRGSVRVKAGDRVERGVVIAKCGNSGTSMEPHLHYHMQSTASFLLGAGIPAQFEHYTADGKAVARGEPVRGQVVRPS
jgi:murein DD-endopeptidase MepM/ murein hydrolase activator NlpD